MMPREISATSSNLNTAFRIIKEGQKKFKTSKAEEWEKEVKACLTHSWDGGNFYIKVCHDEDT